LVAVAGSILPTLVLGSSSVCTTASEAAPSVITEGADIAALSGGYLVIASADAGQTFSATPAGSLLAYLWDDTVSAWVRAPDYDLPMSVASQRRQSWAPFGNLNPRGRIAFVPSSVGVTSGGVTVEVVGTAWRRP
jgi:hypothetical protein